MLRKSFDRLLAAVLIAAAGLCCFASKAAADGAFDASARVVLTEQEQAFEEHCGTLKVGFVQDRIPVSFADENGELAGISRYILDRVEQLSGLDFEYVPLPTGAVTYDYLQQGGFALVTSVEYNEENKKANGILISEPYLTSRKVIVARNDLVFDRGAELKAALSSGSQTIRKVLGRLFPTFELVDYDSIPACFEAVSAGEADLSIQSQFVAEHWLTKPAFEDLQAIPMMGLDDQLCFSAVVAFGGREGFAPEGGSILIDILDKAIAAMSEDEVSSYTIRGVLENQYSFRLEDFLFRYRYMVAVLAAAAALITVLAVLLVRQRVRSIQARSDAKAKGQFLSTMSHEIRTPLNGLIGLNYLMSQNLDDPERLSGYLRQSGVAARYLLHLVSDVLDMSKLQDEKMELVLRPVDLELLVSTANSVVRGGMAEKGLDFQIDADLPHPCVMGDEMRIQQVLLNLLDNARKFTASGGRVSLRVTQTVREDGAVLTAAEVADTGQGMSEEFQKQVFDSFAQERDTVSKGNQGTGLGMPISRSLARLMGGELTFTSKKGEGTRFLFTFPGEIAVMDRDEEAGPAQAPAQAPAEKKPRVLVAEDNELNGEILTELLESEGFETILAKDGREALDVFTRFLPGTIGVILMDLLMPEMDGFQAAQAIRALDRPDAKTVRIIACTANSLAEDRDKALACGMDDFITKPVDMDELLQKLSVL